MADGCTDHGHKAAAGVLPVAQGVPHKAAGRVGPLTRHRGNDSQLRPFLQGKVGAVRQGGREWRGCKRRVGGGERRENVGGRARRGESRWQADLQRRLPAGPESDWHFVYCPVLERRWTVRKGEASRSKSCRMAAPTVRGSCSDSPLMVLRGCGTDLRDELSHVVLLPVVTGDSFCENLPCLRPHKSVVLRGKRSKRGEGHTAHPVHPQPPGRRRHRGCGRMDSSFSSASPELALLCVVRWQSAEEPQPQGTLPR